MYLEYINQNSMHTYVEYKGNQISYQRGEQKNFIENWNGKKKKK